MTVFWVYVVLNVLGVCWLLLPGTMNALASDVLNLIQGH